MRCDGRSGVSQAPPLARRPPGSRLPLSLLRRRRRKIPGLRSAISAASGADADYKFSEGDSIAFGEHKLDVSNACLRVMRGLRLLLLPAAV